MNASDGLRILLAVPRQLCLVCRSRSHFAAIFVPGNSSHYGARGGKQRWVRYDLCRRCKRRPDVTDVVEGIVLDRLREAS